MLIALALAANPVPPTPARERSVQAAVQVVRSYYAAIQRHDYRAAHAIWSGGQSLAALRRGYAETAWVKLTPIPPFEAEGGAGSVYATINVRLDAALRNGRRQHFAGNYTLRRVNDVDGSNAAQRRWHITSARLKAVPASR
ncbi:hypothetical protein [Sphingomonas crusticola]|uniref:hypothetical protein n=1 Tax=Sphingomonas crusticola TaxID=1697973 RepID=UPI000E23F079|nr:hypothetical protein [Sphingomonas crusticola]